MKALALFACLLIASCASIAGGNGRPVFQRLEFGNDGNGPVSNVHIKYGAINVPSGTANSDYAASHMVAVAESQDLPIPDTAIIGWRSSDGVLHEATAPINSLVSSSSCFHGFRFFFVDDHVDLYLLSRKRDCSRVVEIQRKKVWSSSENANGF